MKQKKQFLSLLFILGVCSACIPKINAGPTDINTISNPEKSGGSGQSPDIKTIAEDAMKAYFTALNNGDYDEAATYFGGSYEILQGYNPTLDPEDQADLLEAGCEMNGLMCLEVRKVVSVQTSDPQVFEFEVEFANPDGSPFVLGPCCGETEETMPPQTTFMINVRCQENGTCLVLDLPPYVP